MSQKYSLNRADLTKIGKGAVIAGSGAVLVYLLPIVNEVDFGDYTGIAVALFSVLINAALKFLEGQKEV